MMLTFRRLYANCHMNGSCQTNYFYQNFEIVLSQWSGSSSVNFWGFIVAEFAELVLGIFAGKDKGLDVLDTLL